MYNLINKNEKIWNPETTQVIYHLKHPSNYRQIRPIGNSSAMVATTFANSFWLVVLFFYLFYYFIFHYFEEMNLLIGMKSYIDGNTGMIVNEISLNTPLKTISVSVDKKFVL